MAVAGALLLAVYTARSRPSEPSAGAWQAATSSGDAAASSAADGGWTPPQWDTAEDPHWKVGIPLRPMDHDIIAALQSGKVDRKDVTDVFPDKPYKVRFAGSPANQTFVYVLIAMDRTAAHDNKDQWDERWDLSQPGTIKRDVPHDPESGGEPVMYTLVKGRWQPH